MTASQSKFVKGGILAGVALLSVPAIAGPKANAAKLLDALQECQAIADGAQRLACYDSRIVPLKQARTEDKNFLSRRVEAKFEPLESTARSVTELQPGTWLLVLADNSVWRTNDDVRFIPKAGQMVKIRKGAIGSFLANIGNEHAVRVMPLR